MSIEEISDMQKDETRCRNCLLKKEDCHAVLFGEYCKLKVKRMLNLFEDAMSRKRAEVLYIKYYRRALHVYSFYKFDKFVRRDKYMYPSDCLANEMEDLLEEIQDNHMARVIQTSIKRRKTTEWVHQDMDYHGIMDD